MVLSVENSLNIQATLDKAKIWLEEMKAKQISIKMFIYKIEQRPRPPLMLDEVF
jgi:hypothetical protein